MSGPAAASPPSDPGASDPSAPPIGQPQWNAEELAKQEAVSSGQPVVVEDLTSEFELVTAQPDGTFVAEVSAVPVRVAEGDDWTPVDTDLSETENGMLAPAATVLPIEFSGGGDQELARLQAQSGEWLSVSWAEGDLPAPVVEGASARYGEVFEGVDLVLTATATGFTQVLVVADAEAAANPALDDVEFTYTGEGLTTQPGEGGTTKVASADGSTALTLGAPVYWDSGTEGSSEAGPGGGAVAMPVASASVPADGVVSIDASPDDAADATYPLFVDPLADGGTAAWAFVDSAYPNQSYWLGAGASDSYAHVGYVQSAWSEDGKAHTARAFYNMATWAVKGKHVTKATFDTTVMWSPSCQTRPIDIYSMYPMTSAPTWNNQPQWGGILDSKWIVGGYSSSCPVQSAGWNVTGHVQAAANNNSDQVTFGLKANNEADTYSWRKLSPYAWLRIEYNTIPAKPTVPAITSGCWIQCGPSPAEWVINQARPTFKVKTGDADGGNLRTRFYIHAANGAGGSAGTLLMKQDVYTAQGVETYWAPYSDLGDGTYQVRAVSSDGTDWGEFSDWTEVIVDRTPPGAIQLSAPPTQVGTSPETRPDVLVNTADFTFTLPSGEALAKAAYSWSDISGLTLDENVACGSTQNDITFACPTSGQASMTVPIVVPKLESTLWVKGWDRAGNATVTTAYLDVYKGRDIANIRAGHQWDAVEAGQTACTSTTPITMSTTGLIDCTLGTPLTLSTTGLGFDTNAFNPNGDGNQTLLQFTGTAATANTAAVIDLSQRFSMGGGFIADAISTERVLMSAVSGGAGIEVVHGTDGKVRARVLSGGATVHEAISAKTVDADTWFYALVAWSPADHMLQLTVTAADQADSSTAEVDTTAQLSGMAPFAISDASRPFSGLLYRPILVAGYTHPELARPLLTGGNLCAVGGECPEA